jgi:hypothetical protein
MQRAECISQQTERDELQLLAAEAQRLINLKEPLRGYPGLGHTSSIAQSILFGSWFLWFGSCWVLGASSRATDVPETPTDGLRGPPAGAPEPPGPGPNKLKTLTFCGALLRGRARVLGRCPGNARVPGYN